MIDGAFEIWINLELGNIGDLYMKGKLASFQQLCEKYSIPSNNFFRYLQIRDLVKSDILNYVMATPTYLDEFLERHHRGDSTISFLYKALEQVKMLSMEKIKSSWEEETCCGDPYRNMGTQS